MHINKNQINSSLSFLIYDYAFHQECVKTTTASIDATLRSLTNGKFSVDESIEFAIGGNNVGALLDHHMSLLQAVRSITYSMELKDVRIAIIVGGIAGILAVLSTSALYLPKYIVGVLKFRSGYIASLKDKRFYQYRNNTEEASVLFGSALWGCALSGTISALVAGTIAFLCSWKESHTVMAAILGHIIGWVLAIAIKILFLCLIRNLYMMALYRDRAGASNIINLVLECWHIVLAAGYMCIQAVCLFTTTTIAMGHADTALPRAFRKDLLMNEAHRHPFIQRLGVLYLMKLKHGAKFCTNAGSTWRLIYVLALMPWLKQYRPGFENYYIKIRTPNNVNTLPNNINVDNDNDDKKDGHGYSNDEKDGDDYSKDDNNNETNNKASSCLTTGSLMMNALQEENNILRLELEKLRLQLTDKYQNLQNNDSYNNIDEEDEEQPQQELLKRKLTNNSDSNNSLFSSQYGMDGSSKQSGNTIYNNLGTIVDSNKPNLSQISNFNTLEYTTRGKEYSPEKEHAANHYVVGKKGKEKHTNSQLRRYSSTAAATINSTKSELTAESPEGEGAVVAAVNNNGEGQLILKSTSKASSLSLPSPSIKSRSSSPVSFKVSPPSLYKKVALSNKKNDSVKEEDDNDDDNDNDNDKKGNERITPTSSQYDENDIYILTDKGADREEEDDNSEEKQEDDYLGERKRSYHSEEQQRSYCSGEQQEDDYLGERQRSYHPEEQQRSYCSEEQQEDDYLDEQIGSYDSEEQQEDYSKEQQGNDYPEQQKERHDSEEQQDSYHSEEQEEHYDLEEQEQQGSYDLEEQQNDYVEDENRNNTIIGVEGAVKPSTKPASLSKTVKENKATLQPALHHTDDSDAAVRSTTTAEMAPFKEPKKK